MPEQDRYIPGVPCWIDTNQPDPDAAVAVVDHRRRNHRNSACRTGESDGAVNEVLGHVLVGVL